MEKHIDIPWALKKTIGGKLIGRFEDVGFSCSFVDDAEAEELHDAAGSVTLQLDYRLKEREIWPAVDINTQPIH